MKISTPCPNCQENLSLGAFLIAPTPLTIRCSHCSSKIHVRCRGLAAWFGAALAAFLIVAVAAVASLRFIGPGAFLVTIAATVAVWLLTEVFAASWLFTHATFVAEEKPRSRPPAPAPKCPNP